MIGMLIKIHITHKAAVIIAAFVYEFAVATPDIRAEEFISNAGV